MKNRKILAFILSAVMVLSLSGCMNQTNVGPTTEPIELIDPVDAAASSERAAYRNIYDYTVTSGFVYPYIEEYAFEIDTVLKEYMVVPGETVKRGDVLIKADEGTLSNQIENMEDQIKNAKTAYDESIENHDKFIEEYRTQIEEARDTIGVWEVVKARIANEPGSAQQIEYINLQIEQLNKKIPGLEVNIEEQQMYKNQETELYILDSAQRQRQLDELKNKISFYSLKSNIDGTVVSSCEVNTGSWVAKNNVVIAVGDDTKKQIRCEYVDKMVVSKCDDYYAIINGNRYELEYVPYTSAEYEKLSGSNGVVYSSFIINDPDNEVEIGELASIALIRSRKENVLTVPKNAIHKDAAGQFVYCMVDGNSVAYYIKTGVNDGVYTEVISGINEGDEVLLTANNTYGSKTVTLSKRNFENSFSGNGYITYPMVTPVKNPIKYGTTYLVEFNVTLYSHVEKGDLIATVIVKGDEIALKEKEDELRRHRERLEAELSVEEDKQNKYNIEYRQKAIESLTEQIEELKNAYATTQIFSETSGIVSWIEFISEGSVLNYDANLAYIADEDRCFIAVKDEKRNLVLGSEVEIGYKEPDGTPATARGKVVNASNAALSKNLVSSYAYIQVPAEAVVNMPAITLVNDMFYDRTRFDVSTATRRMENVLAIPRSAVKEINGKTYAFIINDDGTITAQCFVPGGSDSNYYWVMEGLEEGMNVCSE